MFAQAPARDDCKAVASDIQVSTIATQFCAYELRTTDVTAALAFYADVLGAGFCDSHVTAGVSPELAAAQGAPPHWLGTIGVSEVSSVVESAGRRFRSVPEAARCMKTL